MNEVSVKCCREC